MGPDVAVLPRHPLFRGMAAVDWDALLDQAERRNVPVGTDLVRAGAPATHLFLILGGEIELTPPGEPPLRLHCGDCVGEDAVLATTPHSASARVVADALVAAVNGANLNSYFDTHFNASVTALAELAANLRNQVRQITELKLQSTTERLAHFLASLTECAAGPVRLRLRVEKRELASQLGMDPATLSRAFAKLRKLGVDATQRDLVVIDDVAVLRHLGGLAEPLC
ncbi:MAG: helix-turn-helix domain-containing protein [Rhodospirillaceae bacterium]|nr:helix-turn-helix domain-containing protein [Rhodospirillales bacterium]